LSSIINSTQLPAVVCFTYSSDLTGTQRAMQNKESTA
jgi:hypothetical protein